ncbi:hypothetical protein O9992_26495 [Vibrio lentus]|nr:hypothetical protein [Vibrio lentus]
MICFLILSRCVLLTSSCSRGGMLFICFGIVWLVANRLSQPLNTLMQLTDNIARFDFRRTGTPRQR